MKTKKTTTQLRLVGAADGGHCLASLSAKREPVVWQTT